MKRRIATAFAVVAFAGHIQNAEKILRRRHATLHQRLHGGQATSRGLHW